MRQSSKVEGIKIAQAAKDLNVTSVTIRRYLQEFNIDTIPDDNGIKVLPTQALEELREIRRLKEEGLTNPKVLEILEERREKSDFKPSDNKTNKSKLAEQPEKEEDDEEDDNDDKVKDKSSSRKKLPSRRGRKEEQANESTEETIEPSPPDIEVATEQEAATSVDELPTDSRPKHTLTCQTCGKTFEHMNPRLRDCLDCYRTKRKERRRGGDRHRNVIQHPLAQQVMNKSAQQNQLNNQQQNLQAAPPHQPIQQQSQPAAAAAAVIPQFSRVSVRNYRKAIEETRQITGSLKRRLERPDLPEGERRWLEQIYAYQLILHQGWRHLSEYKSAGTPQPQSKQAE